MKRKNHKFKLVDAFTTRPLAGNPCAVVFDAELLSDDEMLRIAKEMNQSETAFLMSSKQADLKARYFTPEREIPLAGHPTLASIHAAVEENLLRLSSETTSFSLELNDGPIQVDYDSYLKGEPLIRMHQRKPLFLSIHDPVTITDLFGIDPEDLLANAPIQTVSTGTPQLMIPLKSQTALRKIKMNAESYRRYRKTSDFFSPHLFCLEAISPDAQTFARHLGTPPDTQEDSFTGSATGGMAAYLWHHGLISQSMFIAEQGHWMGRPGRAWIRLTGEPHQIEGVSVAGSALTVADGTLRL